MGPLTGSVEKGISKAFSIAGNSLSHELEECLSLRQQAEHAKFIFYQKVKGQKS